MFCLREGHSTIPISIYCTGDACKKSVCTTCWIDDHKNPEEHSQQDIKEKFNKEMNMLKDKATETNVVLCFTKFIKSLVYCRRYMKKRSWILGKTGLFKKDVSI
jgi:hypothetical protein